MDRETFGVTTCDYCRARFRVQPKHAQLEGKPVRCPKCHRPFILKIERPTSIEEAAVQNSQRDAKSKQRRTKAQIRNEHLKGIRKSIRPFHARLSEIIAQESSSEEEVRRWCIDVLKAALGYEDANIDTELRALNQRIDIALKQDDKVFMIIECKNARSKLPNNVRDQAVMYAVNKSADWAVATNGAVWKLYRVFPQKGCDPRVVQVFDIALLDEDGVSEHDIECLYLLTERALFSGDTEAKFHRMECLSKRNLLNALTSERVLKAMRRQLMESYKSECDQNVRISEEIIEDRVRGLFLPEDL